ncbi:GAF and ANTAR domain-containing protein [Amycolatopsis decaplanina]|uniref:ANTAR domain-containing protein n=1 Tax=Amycolatopsis decaplanina DSM 44594 TaxID=1284240 RepID=M2WUP7_9PSEU|nr:GAF and ANTAR domain-containing protein [Amycolatopsis decaplanina]EME52481.1 ANTAR domain-containing protein [Amycolatopsis decaplanina DSM 44594]
MDHELRLAETFIELADTVKCDFDVVKLLGVLAARCTELLDITSAGLFLAPAEGMLRPVAASHGDRRLADLLDAASDEGPVAQCYRTAEQVGPIEVGDRRPELWPAFTSAATRAGYRHAHALPLRLREETLGVLLLLRREPAPCTWPDIHLAQSLADVAAIGILHERAVREQTDMVTQLNNALQSRVLIEQAKGALSARRNTTVDKAFEDMRAHARRNQRKLSEVARHVIEAGTLPVPRRALRH